MKRKLFRRAGLTLAEMLIAVAILAVFASMAVVGTTAMFNTGEQMKQVAKAEVLGSDVLQIIMNELRFGEEFSIPETNLDDVSKDAPTLTGEKVKFNSSSYGDNCTMYLVKEASAAHYGELILEKPPRTVEVEGSGTGASDTPQYQPIGTVAYQNVFVSSLTFTLTYDVSSSDKTLSSIEVSIKTNDNSGHVLWSGSVTIKPICAK